MIKKLRYLMIITVLILFCFLLISCEKSSPSENEEIKFYTVQITSDNLSAGEISKGDDCIAGTEITLTATPNLGFVFNGWYENETLISKNEEYLYLVPNRDCCITAKWKIEDGLNDIIFKSTKDTFEVVGTVNKNISSIKLPNYTTKISDSAFAFCKNLSSIDIPNSVLSLGESAFQGCETLSDVVLAEGLKEINDGAFSGCESLKSLEIPNSVNWIGSLVFSSCSSLESLKLPYSIGPHQENTFGTLFSGFISRDIDVDTDACLQYHDDFGYHYFHIPSSLHTITISKGKIPAYAFSGCKDLKNIILETQVESIGYESFSNCSSIKEIIIPNNVNLIGRGSFRGCSSLEKISLPFIGKNMDSVEEEGVLGYIFGYTIQTGRINKPADTITLQYYEDFAHIEDRYYYYYIPVSLRSVKITGTKIKGESFINCVNLESVIIEKSVVKIEWDAFKGCSKLSQIKYCGTRQEWDNVSKYSSLANATNSGIIVFEE